MTFAYFKLWNQKTLVRFDSTKVISCVSRAFLNRIEVPDDFMLGSEIATYFPLKCYYVNCMVNCFVIDTIDGSDFILGQGFLCKYKVKLDYAKKIVKVKSARTAMIGV